MKPELKEQVSRLEKQEEDFLAGTATLCLHCPFCTEELLLLDKRPDIQNLVWCSASTGEEHSSCTERRHWKGALLGTSRQTTRRRKMTTTTTTTTKESSSNKKKGENNSSARACFIFIYIKGQVYYPR